MAFSRPSVPTAENVDLKDIRLITRLPENDPVSLQALIIGRLWIHENCITIGETLEKSRTAIWRAGFVVGKDEKGLFVHHPDQKPRHRIGDKVYFGGGYLNDFDASWIVGRDFKGCLGPFILVDETSIRPKRFWQW